MLYRDQSMNGWYCAVWGCCCMWPQLQLPPRAPKGPHLRALANRLPLLVSIRAYKKIEEDDLKFPLIYGEGKKVQCWDVRGGVPAALEGGGLVASQQGPWHCARVVPCLALLNWGSQAIFSSAVTVPMPCVSSLLGEEVEVR